MDPAGEDVSAPVYVEYRPPARDLFDVPRAALYAAMGAALVFVFAYAIVGHLIKDLIHHCLDWTLGPQKEDLKESNKNGTPSPAHAPMPLALSHSNAFHLWDQDDVVIPPSPEESPPFSPLLAVLPYIPNFFHSPPLALPHPHVPHRYLPQSHLPHTQLSPVWSPAQTHQEVFF